MKKTAPLMIILVFIFSNPVFCQQGKLAKGKESLISTSSSSSYKKSTQKRSSTSTDNERFFGSFFGEILAKTFVYITYGIAIETPLEFDGKMHDASIATYPYQNSSYGNFIYTDSTNYNLTRFDFSNNFVIENSQLYGANFGVNFRFLKRFSLDVDYLYLTEKRHGNRDTYSLFGALLKYYRVRTQRFDAWFGLGLMHVANQVDTTGFGLGVGAEWFVTKPISVDFSHKWGYINDNTVQKNKLLLKYHLKNYHISSGYEHFKIGVSSVTAFSIGFGASF